MEQLPSSSIESLSPRCLERPLLQVARSRLRLSSII